MILVLPLGTDAPVYHFPYTTIGLIAVNVAAFIWKLSIPADDIQEVLIPWILQFGVGIKPVQWITHAFLHAGFMHILANMLFLWAFGLIVEGKLGWWKFLLVYLGLAGVQGAFEQVLMLGHDPEVLPNGSLGASGAIFGVMAIALIWAPANEVNCYATFMFFRHWVFEAAVSTLSIAFLVMQIIVIALQFLFTGEVSWSSETIHLSGAALGFIYGIASVKLNWVDCEHWDLFTVWAGHAGQSPEQIAEQQAEREAARAEVARIEAERQKFLVGEPPAKNITPREAAAKLTKLIEAGQGQAAFDYHQRLLEQHVLVTLEEPTLAKFVETVHRANLQPESIPLMEWYLDTFEERAIPMRLRLAHILVEFAQRPRAAIEQLKLLPRQGLQPRVKEMRDQLARAAQQLLAEGIDDANQPE